MNKRFLVWPAIVFFFCSVGLARTAAQLFADPQAEKVTIQSYHLSVPNNTQEPYRFTLSVLGLGQADQFLPLLAIAIRPLSNDQNEWMAIWNLSQTDPGWLQRTKALVPHLWSGQDIAEKGEENLLDEDLDFPSPYLTWEATRGQAKRSAGWGVFKKVAGWANLFNPFRFAVESYTHYRDDLTDRRFHQVYTLLLLYQAASIDDPSLDHLSPSSLLDLKYHLLVNRSPFGLLFGGEPSVRLVESYESHQREQLGKVASYLHSEANFYHLGVEMVDYGIPGQPPVSRAAVLFIRGVDTPEATLEWPTYNPFDLSYNPFTHPEVQALVKHDPEEKIPLAFYVLNSDFQLKPILVADFFQPATVRKREFTNTMKVAVDHLLAVNRLPFLYNTARRVVEYSLHRKDFTRFASTSVTAGVEQTRLFARLGWNFDSDTNDILLRFLERRIVNPLSESFERQTVNNHRNFAALLHSQEEPLQLALRRLFENRVRSTLDLGNQAIFAQHLQKYRDVDRFQRAKRLIENFNDEVHLSGYSWEQVASAWEILVTHDKELATTTSRVFLERIHQLSPSLIPASYAGRLFAAVPVLRAEDRSPEPLDAETFN